jgi:hypothetical protein
MKAKLYLLLDGGKEYIAVITDNDFLTDVLEDYKVVDIKELNGEFGNWPTNRLMQAE